MVEKFLKIDLLGDLYISEIYFFYEEPQIFSCTDKIGQKYLVLLINMDTKEWIINPISEAQLSLIKNNRISFRESFLNPEVGFIWKVNLNVGSEIASAIQISPNLLDDTDLPDNDLYCDWTQSDLMPISDDNIIQTSKKEGRDIVDISLEVAGGHQREIDCEVLGEILTNTQQLIYSLAYKSNSLKGKYPKLIKDRNTLYVAGTFAASFGIRFKSYDLCNLLGETEVTDTLNILSNLFSTKNSVTELKCFLDKQSKRSVIKYRNLMKTLFEANAGFKVKVASPNNNYSYIRFSSTDIIENLKALDGEIKNMVSIETMYGEIVGINVERKTFAFKSIEGEHITGKLSENFTDKIFEVPKNVEIKVEQQVDLNDLTHEEKYIYTLLEIEEIVPIEESKKD